jgi:hypothetical protein
MFTKAGLMWKILLLQSLDIWYGCCDQEAKTIRFAGPYGMAGTYHALVLHSKFISNASMLNVPQLLYCRRRSIILANFSTRFL